MSKTNMSFLLKNSLLVGQFECWAGDGLHDKEKQ